MGLHLLELLELLQRQRRGLDIPRGRRASAALGGRFHRNRLRLISSQVSTVNPALAGRWDKPRRMELAWRMVQKLEPQRLIGLTFPLAQCQQAFEAASARREGVMQVIFRY